MPKTFVSYSHTQGRWVWSRLQPVLDVAGADVLIDLERFTAGKAVFDQMDDLQDQADFHLLCLSDEYLASPACRHEMERAIAGDPDFSHGRVIPILLSRSLKLPDAIKTPDPLRVDLTDDRNPKPWQMLLKACGLTMSAGPVAWLEVIDETAGALARMQSVNLVAENGVESSQLLDHLIGATHPSPLVADLKRIDLASGSCASRRGLLGEILRSLGIKEDLPKQRRAALVEFDRLIDGLPEARLALTHFDMVESSERRDEYGDDLFAALYNLVTMRRKLGLLVVSRRPYATFLPKNHPISAIPFIHVPLKADR